MKAEWDVLAAGYEMDFSCLVGCVFLCDGRFGDEEALSEEVVGHCGVDGDRGAEGDGDSQVSSCSLFMPRNLCMVLHHRRVSIAYLDNSAESETSFRSDSVYARCLGIYIHPSV